MNVARWMIAAVALMFILVVCWGLSGCASPKLGDDEIHISDARQAQCAEEGGCVLMTKKAIALMLILTAGETCKGTDI